MKSGNLNFLEPSGPLQDRNGAALTFTRSKNLQTQGKYRSKEETMEIKTGDNGGGLNNVYVLWSPLL